MREGDAKRVVTRQRGEVGERGHGVVASASRRCGGAGRSQLIGSIPIQEGGQ